ncbi:MAG: tetratricopeptide repeat protein [Hyphomonas sp.]
MFRLLHLAAAEGELSAELALCAFVDESEAMRLLVELADGGSSEAQFILAGFYRDGQGVPLDETQAALLYRMAADQGHIESQYQLGLVLRTGNGVPRDQLEGMRRLTQAAEGGHRQAQMTLGEAYQHSDAYRNPSEAIRWYRMAAEQGHPGAQFALAARFERGEGVPRNTVTAHMWYNIAHSQGSYASEKTIERIESGMTREQIFEAQALATQCYNSDYKDCGW